MCLWCVKLKETTMLTHIASQNNSGLICGICLLESSCTSTENRLRKTKPRKIHTEISRFTVFFISCFYSTAWGCNRQCPHHREGKTSRWCFPNFSRTSNKNSHTHTVLKLISRYEPALGISLLRSLTRQTAHRVFFMAMLSLFSISRLS